MRYSILERRYLPVLDMRSGRFRGRHAFAIANHCDVSSPEHGASIALLKARGARTHLD